MSNNINSSSFPKNPREAIAYLFVKSQDLTGKSPSEIYSIYCKAYDEITENYPSGKTSAWK